MAMISSPARAALAMVALSMVNVANAQLYDKVIETIYGPVQGYQYFNQTTLNTYFPSVGNSSSVAAFLGIPYAADTSYANRWRAPQPREIWNETLVADSFGEECPSSAGYGSASYSEDCLSLNIWTNATSAEDKLPVLVWNQGSEETSDTAWWYGGGLALKGVVTVTFNRRDDAFGYLAHPELNAESEAENGHSSSGVYGVLDHLEVLNWVQKNIANFGGDPERVTIAGQSFGSGQVYHAVNSPLFKDKFHGAISESGIRYPYDTLVAGLATSYVDMSLALEFGLNYTANHNVSTIAELRNLTTAELMEGSTDRITSKYFSNVTALSTNYPLIFKPVLDGYVLPERYIDQLLAGPANDVPLITGNTKDESGASTSLDLYTPEQYTTYCTEKYGNLSSEYFGLYPAGNTNESASRSWNAAATDTSLVSTWLYARDWVLRSNATSPIYTYFWDHAPPGQTQGASHQSEIMYVLNALYANADDYPFTWEDYAIQEAMSAYWVNFIRTGNPNEGGAYPFSNLTHWTPNDGVSRTVMELGDGFGNYTLTNTEAHQTLIEEYFAQQSPF